MAKKTYVSPGILLLQAGGDPGTGGNLPFASENHEDELAKPGPVSYTHLTLPTTPYV